MDAETCGSVKSIAHMPVGVLLGFECSCICISKFAVLWEHCEKTLTEFGVKMQIHGALCRDLRFNYCAEVLITAGADFPAISHSVKI